MPFRRPLLFGLLLALAPGATRGADAWSQLKLGMTPGETTAVLGTPLVRTSGRGFEIWSYDNGAEALLYGSLIGWTVTGSANVVDRSFDIWRARRAESDSPTFLELLPRPAIPSSPPKRGDGGVVLPKDEEWIPLYARRRS